MLEISTEVGFLDLIAQIISNGYRKNLVDEILTLIQVSHFELLDENEIEHRLLHLRDEPGPLLLYLRNLIERRGELEKHQRVLELSKGLVGYEPLPEKRGEVV